MLQIISKMQQNCKLQLQTGISIIMISLQQGFKGGETVEVSQIQVDIL